MDDFLRDIGLEIAKNLPVAIGTSLIPIVFLIWLIYKVRTSEDSAEHKNILTAVLSIPILILAAGLPKAYAEAKELCRDIGATQTVPNTFDIPNLNDPPELNIPNPDYYAAKCSNIWPNGQGL